MTPTKHSGSTLQTIAIIHGWAEGRRLSRRLVDMLQQRGFAVIDDPAVADIVFAHSLGCYLIPVDCQAKLIFLIGIPSVPTRSLPVALMKKLVDEVAHHRARAELLWWCKKAAYGVWCAVSRPHSLYYLFTKRKPENLPSAKERAVVVIRPQNDPFMPPNVADALKDRGYSYRESQGMHDDCWLDVDSYADAVVEAIGSLKR